MENSMTALPEVEVAEDLAEDPNFIAYQREKETLRSDHEGKYVAYCRGRRVAIADSSQEIASALDSRFPDEECFVKLITREPRKIVFRRPHKLRPAFPVERR